MDALLEKARRIRLLVLDVDGVLTDGRLYFTADGEQLKVFDVRDGYGLVALQRAGVAVAIISGRESDAVRRRAAELGITRVNQGVQDKAARLDSLLEELAVEPREVACIGDDVPDLPMLRRAGLAIAVADAHPLVQAETHWTTSQPGGRGAVREACDLLLSARAG
jgi:3-deoxy-D-manno-octulosonate 8-phosphate phosphatase (KDO 8-P phosphatase)